MTSFDVLIIDSEEAEAQAVSDKLCRLGLSTIVCCSEEDGIHHFENNEFSIVVLAINAVPGSGQQFYASFQARQQSRRPSPLLMVAGVPTIKREWYRSLVDRGRSVVVEANKPYDVDELTSMVRRILQTHEQCQATYNANSIVE